MFHNSLSDIDSSICVDDYVLIVKNLSFSYRNKQVIRNIDMLVKKGEIFTILGPNGGGKTSLVRILVGIHKNYTGCIEYMDNIVISYLPQSFVINNLMPMTVEYFLLYSLLRRKVDIDDIIKDVNIESILDQQLSELSAGQMQLVLLARCLMSSPDLIILDEPVSFMDINAKVKFYDLISKLVKKRSISIIMTSHDLRCALRYSDNVMCINCFVYCQGMPNEIEKDRNFITIFRGYFET
ncbi:metal ABC transporter ATP-binding protein [Candidatus Mesenet endosymbiont of Agriotes lineatus]|uniref:metal ABC transporter ATP-binding protein n=1 Tax=Candidatus Mesenet endosymbiont of Agriotes lineatus TaxID=3077948 RepID=UPI0030CB862C